MISSLTLLLRWLREGLHCTGERLDFEHGCDIPKLLKQVVAISLPKASTTGVNITSPDYYKRMSVDSHWACS